MAQHRTKQDKMAAQMRREEQLQYNLSQLYTEQPLSNDTLTHSTKSTVTSKQRSQQFNLKHLKADFLRSGVSALVIVTALIGLWFWLS